jgi:hypothetical protein
MYFEPFPPTRTQKFADKQKYFNDKVAIIKGKKNGFLTKQIVSIENKEKFEWVEDSLIKPFKGVASFDLKCVGIKNKEVIKRADELHEEVSRDSIGGIAVQIIDYQHIFIIPVRSDRALYSNTNDCYRRDVGLVRSFRRYFDELWASRNCLELMNDGKVNEENISYIKEIFGCT